MQKHKVHILDHNLHRRDLYTRHLEQLGYEVGVLNMGVSTHTLMLKSSCLILSLPDDKVDRATVIKMFSGSKLQKPLFVLDSLNFSHLEFQDLLLVGHINRRALSLTETIKHLADGLKNLLK